MPSKKKKYNSRFPPARIKKIMQTDEEIGKVSAVVPVLISKCLELFLASILQHAGEVTKSKHAKTMSTSHLRECVETVSMFDFLKDVVASMPESQAEEESNSIQPNSDSQDFSKNRSKPVHGVANKRLKLGKSDSDLEIETDSDEKDGDLKRVCNSTPDVDHTMAADASIHRASLVGEGKGQLHSTLDNLVPPTRNLAQPVPYDWSQATENNSHPTPQNPVDMTYHTLNTIHRQTSHIQPENDNKHEDRTLYQPPSYHAYTPTIPEGYKPSFGNGTPFSTLDTKSIADFSYPYNPVAEHSRTVVPTPGSSSKPPISDQDDYDI
uniref:Dr1-associated corepressor n=1 Tax=Ciona savignyi TaxID=51511 RepID=H2ZNW6_CIOSA